MLWACTSLVLPDIVPKYPHWLCGVSLPEVSTCGSSVSGFVPRVTPNADLFAVGQFLSNAVIQGTGNREDKYAYRIPL